jgi:MFS family permease
MNDRLLSPERRPVVLALMSVIAIASYNNLSAAAALPDIGDDLGDISLLPFVITVELLTSAVAVLAAGPVVDGFGARRTFRVAAAGFVVTSLVVAGAPTMPALIAARAVQGVFAGVIMTVAVASIGLAIPAKLRPRAFAMTSSVWGVMGVAGPAIAAVLVATVGWRGIFLVNVPVTVAAAIVGWNRIPDRQAGAERQRFDAIGLALVAVLTTGALALASARVVIILVAGALVLATAPIYLMWSKRTADPVVRIAHLFDARYRTVHLTSMAVLAGGVGANSFLPLYMRTVKGHSSSGAAFSVLFLTVGWSVSAYVSSRLQDRWVGEWVSLLGSMIATPAVFATALVIYVDAPVWLIYAAFFWLGSGVGMITSTGAALLQSRTAATEMGRLNAAHQFLRTLSLTFGIAVVGAVTLAVVDTRTGNVEIVRDVLAGEDVNTSSTVLEAIGDGYALAILVMAIAVSASVPSAIRLVRTRGQEVASGT